MKSDLHSTQFEFESEQAAHDGSVGIHKQLPFVYKSNPTLHLVHVNGSSKQVLHP